MSALASLKEVEDMLSECAPGYTIELKTHFRMVRWKSLTYHRLPKGKDIEAGHIRSMARLFGILDCAKSKVSVL